MCRQSGNLHPAAAEAMSGNPAAMSRGVMGGSQNDRTPAVSMTAPPPGMGISRGSVVVCRPLRSRSDTAPVARGTPVSAVVRVDLPTPECPASTATR